MDLNPDGLGEDPEDDDPGDDAATPPEGPPPFLFKSFNFDGAFAMPSFFCFASDEVDNMYFYMLLSGFSNCNFGQLHVTTPKNAVCKRRDIKYVFLCATVRFFEMQFRIVACNWP